MTDTAELDATALDLAAPSSYVHFTEEKVRFCDTDAIGHVNNVSHVALVESGRIAYLLGLGEAAGLQIASITFAHLDIDFRAELHYPATVRIGARAVAVGRTSITVAVGVFDGDRCVTTSRNVMVHVDGGRPAPWPEQVRAAILAEIG